MFVAIRSTSALTQERRRFYARLLRFSLVSRSSTLLLRSDPWYGRLRGDINSPKSSERKGSFLETFWCTTTHEFYSLVARSQMGRRDIKTGCAYSSRRNAVYIRSPYSRYIHVFPPRRTYCLSFSMTSSPTLHRYVFAHMFRFRKSDFIQNLCVVKSVKHNFINLFTFLK